MKRPGRAGRPDYWYAEKARRYVLACTMRPHAPVAWLVERATQRETSDQWRGWLNRARNLGLLTASPTGLAGGELTPKGWAALLSSGPAKLPEPRALTASRRRCP